jgi:hypothetical protein
VPLVARLEDQVARPGLDDLVAEQGAHAAFEDEAVLVLAGVQVQRRRERPRRHRVLHEREAHPDGSEEALRAFLRPYDLHARGCRLHLSSSFRFTTMSSDFAQPSERLETALRELYGYYERLEPLLGNVQRDAAVMPLVAEMNAYRARYLEEIRDLLLQAWPTRGGAKTRLQRAIGDALEFRTWQSLVRRQGCTNDEAVQLMVAFACANGSGNAGKCERSLVTGLTK